MTRSHIVQVILTRLQRVTLLTAHKYLGLTREVIRTEQAINDLACYPLPNSFWENGGIQRLRARFVPETKMGPNEGDLGGGGSEEMEDYFGKPGAGLNGRKGSMGKGNGIGGRRKDRGMPLETPYAGPRMGEVFWSDELDSSEHEGIRLKLKGGGGGSSTSGITRKAGDLLTMSSVKGSMASVGSPVVQTPRLERMRSARSTSGGGGGGEEEFDLRGAVMECISKAIGLVQPHVTPSTSVQASPSVGPHEYPSSPSPGISGLRSRAAFNSSFSSLSLLGLQGLHDDESSVSSLSQSGMFAGGLGSASHNFASMDLENEVEILYFPKDSMLVKEGEKNAGLYFVIEGFLDVSMPDEGPVGGAGKGGMGGRKNGPADSNQPSPPTSSRTGQKKPTFPPPPSSSSSSKPSLNQSASFRNAKNKSVPFSATKGPKAPGSQQQQQKKQQQQQKKSIPLFTVRPGGIAGYLSSLTGFPSYVDITAKTECYVGFLPAKALERIMDRKPIVLLTLAKRLISLLSPLGTLESLLSFQ